MTDLALGDGCVYTTGFEYTDLVTRAYATVKYDYSGQQMWARNYGLGGTNGSAQANAVAVDAAGNVLVTGWSYDYDPGPPFEQIIVDAATLKYDPEGNLLWEHRYRLPGHNNQPNDVIIDSAGKAYVAGAAWVLDGGGGFDLMLLKYSPGGVLLWDRIIGKSGDRWDNGYQVALDPDENPVVAGYTQPFLFNPTTFGYLVKYSASGDLLWQRDHESCSNCSTWWRVAINAAGQIYTLGQIAPCGDLCHVWTSQYSSNGTLTWDRHYDGNASGENYARGLALTPAGGVVACGTSDDIDAEGGVQSIVTIRYEPNGAEVWQDLERGGYAQAQGRDVAVDSAGNAYVTGFAFNQNENVDFVTLKYTADGDLAWTQPFDAQGHSDYPIRIAVDDVQNVFVAGYGWFGFENHLDYATIRYTASSFADLDGSGSVDVLDLLALIGAWGACPPSCSADLNGDQVVNVLDVLLLISSWG
ncbi:MAG: SBBP repeat-containing protein [Phycisphaerales bacterium]|nr:SBBP repeat-containing protein [Phycisphaerales bacterium]MCI0676315.1 SBBP repeat-containing protein [Phycisphaerales bacterium]